MAARVCDLRADQRSTPLGIVGPAPRLSWRLEGCVRQQGYRIRAALTRAALAAGDCLWDSGAVRSDATFDIPWGGPPPPPATRIHWTVEVVADGATLHADPSWFETALDPEAPWPARWLEAEDALAAADRAAGVPWLWAADPLDPRPHGFRLDFIAPDDVVAAQWLVSGKDHLRGVWLNGRPAALDRPFGYDSQLPFWGTLTRFEGAVGAGRNSLCALVEAECTGFFPVDGGAFAALVRLIHADGRISRITAHDARVCADPPPGWQDAAFSAAHWPQVQPSGSRAAGDPRPAEPVMLLRHEFTLDRPVRSARLYATALGSYAARINGQPVADHLLAPEPTVASSHLLYQIHDVTALVQPGRNAIGALLGCGYYASAFGWRIERYGFGPAPRRFSAALRLVHADGSEQWITTGEGWTISPSHILSSELYDGEDADLRLRQSGWDQPGFSGPHWAPAQIGAAPPARLIPQCAPPIRPLHRLPPVAITEPAPGVFVADFGRNIAGWAQLNTNGPAGQRITARYAELLGADGCVDQSNLRLARATDRFTLAGGPATLEPHFTYHGFRYVQLEGWPGRPDAAALAAIACHSDCPEAGDIAFADAPLLQAIWDNTRWSQRANFFGVPTDCPQRDERMGWMGDIQIFLDAGAFAMDVGPFLRRFLCEARAAQRADGGYPIVVPQPLSYPDVVTAGWSEAGIILPFLLWQRSGDTAVIHENWAAMERWMAFVARANPDHVWRHERGLDLGDWLSVDAVKPDDETTPRALCATAYWARVAGHMAAMADAIGRAADAGRYRALRAAIAQAYAAEFVAADGRCGNGSQTSQILSLSNDLVPAPQQAAAAQWLADDIRARGGTLSTGFLGTPHILDVLADHGHADTAAGLLMHSRYPGWGYMVAQGATSLWERWNSDTGDVAMNSYNHYAFGAVAGFFFRRLAGIAPAAPGFRRIAVRPLWLPAVGRVSAWHDAVVGRIATRTDGDASGLSRLELQVPANCTARVDLPANGRWLWNGAAPATADALESVGPGAHIFHRA